MNRRRNILLFVAVLVLALGARVGAGYLGWRAAGPLVRPVALVVPEGANLSTISTKLRAIGAITSPKQFRLRARFLGASTAIKAGEYELPAHASESAILSILTGNDTLNRFVMVPEGMPSIMVYDRLVAQPYLSGSVAVPQEGSILPDSYAVERGETRQGVVNRMQAAMQRTVNELWAKRKGDCPVSTPQQALTLASIVEKETGKASERRLVAGVYCNRLKIGMKLDADPTVIYPITKGKPLGRRIKRSELDAITGYNTYREPGLPAGPIANPGKLSIAAVLDPAPTKALYFVADGTGGHVFADTLAEHNANVAKWFAIRRARGEM